MDFWEGFFLGKYWTDSNFEDKSRKLFFLIISALVCFISTIYFIFPQQKNQTSIIPFWIYLLLGIGLLILMPFAAARYHRLNVFLKLGILFGYFLQYLLLLIGFSKIVFGQVALEVATIPSLFLEVLDQIMYSSGEIFIFLGGLGSTIASVIGGIIIGGLLVGLFLLAAILIPLIYILSFRALQRLIDKTLYEKKFKTKA